MIDDNGVEKNNFGGLGGGNDGDLFSNIFGGLFGGGGPGNPFSFFDMNGGGGNGRKPNDDEPKCDKDIKTEIIISLVEYF
jgi:DnaJ-class molecular chaperone